jgi:hypothetical protein
VVHLQLLQSAFFDLDEMQGFVCLFPPSFLRLLLLEDDFGQTDGALFPTGRVWGINVQREVSRGVVSRRPPALQVDHPCNSRKAVSGVPAHRA